MSYIPIENSLQETLKEKALLLEEVCAKCGSNKSELTILNLLKTEVQYIKENTMSVKSSARISLYSSEVLVELLTSLANIYIKKNHPNLSEVATTTSYLIILLSDSLDYEMPQKTLLENIENIILTYEKYLKEPESVSFKELSYQLAVVIAYLLKDYSNNPANANTWFSYFYNKTVSVLRFIKSFF